MEDNNNLYSLFLPPFFIFLDIDGTLWDYTHTKFETFKYYDYKNESVDAVNRLVAELKQRDLCPVFVIISKQRSNWKKCLADLDKNGIDQNVACLKLPIGKHTRGERISLFLHDYETGKDVSTGDRDYSIFDRFHFNYAKKYKNYVVIDDDRIHLSNIPASHHIKTDIKYRALDNKHIDEFLERLDKGFEEEPEK